MEWTYALRGVVHNEKIVMNGCVLLNIGLSDPSCGREKLRRYEGHNEKSYGCLPAIPKGSLTIA